MFFYTSNAYNKMTLEEKKIKQTTRLKARNIKNSINQNKKTESNERTRN